MLNVTIEHKDVECLLGIKLISRNVGVINGAIGGYYR